jgi:hypothetical protein
VATALYLAGMECDRLGIDVYVTNPCDVLGRLFTDMLPVPGAVGALIKAAFWFGRKLAWWWVITVLLAAVLIVVTRSKVIQACHDRYGRHRN